MTETAHTRSRRASLGGLVIQLVAFGGVIALSYVTNSLAMRHLAWFVLGGVPLWFVSLLVFRQRELAALESLDLEELRRERQAGGGEALFDESGFRVAEVRLRAMERWYIPVFSLLTVAYLAAMGVYLWRRLADSDLTLGAEIWPAPVEVPVGMVVISVLMLGTFLFSRYASGMGRVREWQLLRGCGSYMLGNALFMVAVLVCFGVVQYARVPTWEQALAWVIPFVMIVLALEMVINFVLDIYRPRTPGVEPRAAFDSRLLGLIAEPGGIASSIADAINYQFGFQVSQTWFYRLLERWLARLLAAGAVALWLLTCVVITQPNEHVIVERFGRQLNAESPLGPGIHFKLPWPIDVARGYNTGQVRQIFVGYQQFDATPEIGEGEKPVLLWTDVKHFNLAHSDFLLNPSTPKELGLEGQNAEDAAVERGAQDVPVESQPVYLIRLEAAIQYRISAARLKEYTRAMANPHRTMLNVAWEEVGRHLASLTVTSLMGTELAEVADVLKQRISERVAQIGLEVAYVSVTNVHPEKSVAEAYRNVVRAEQEKIAAIREARVTENQKLSEAAGQAEKAHTLAQAIEWAREAQTQANRTATALVDVEAESIADLQAQLAGLEELLAAHVRAAAELERVRERRRRVEMDFALGLGETLAMLEGVRREEQVAEQAALAASAALEQALRPIREVARSRLDGRQTAALIDNARARVAQAVWTEELDREFTPARLEGKAAEVLATALADRWNIELSAASEIARVEKERAAFRAAPGVYKSRRLAEVLVEGLKGARKYFLALEPGDRLVRVRFLVTDERADVSQMLPRQER